MTLFAHIQSRLGLKWPSSGHTSDFPGKIRELTKNDHTLFCEHLLRLDPETRRSRFAMPADDAFMRSYAETSFAFGTVIIGYFEDGILRGVAELRALPEPHVAEAAFSVEKAWRRQGIGSQLMQSLLDAAGRQGVDRIYISCMATNTTMQALARKFAARFSYQAGDMIGLIKAPKSHPADFVQTLLSRFRLQPGASTPRAYGQQS